MSDPKNDEPIHIGAKADQSVLCAQCQQEVPAGQYYSFKGKKGQDVFLCGNCRETVEKALQAETQSPNLFGGMLLGLLGGLVAGVVWYLVVVVTSYQIGYVAIGVGYLIGQAVHFGSGKKRGPRLQLLSAGVTLTVLLVAEYFTFLHFLRKYLLEQKTEGYHGQFFLISPFHPAFLQSVVSPMGLLIWAIALYVAFSALKPRTI